MVMESFVDPLIAWMKGCLGRDGRAAAYGHYCCQYLPQLPFVNKVLPHIAMFKFTII